MDRIEFAEFVKARARELAEKETFEPIVFILKDEGIGVFPLSFPKTLWRPILVTVLQQLKADAYVFATEAWRCDLPEDSPWRKKIESGKLRVRDLPPEDLSEDLLVCYVDKLGSKAWIAPIKAGYIGGWKPTDEGGDIELGGEMVIKEW